MASSSKRKLEADLEELQAAAAQARRSSPKEGRSPTQDHSLALAAEVRSEMEAFENARAECSVLREEVSSVERQFQAQEQETELLRHRIVEEEQSVAEWCSTASSAQKDVVDLRKALDEKVQASHHMELQFKAAVESQQAQQARIDEAKRGMVNSAMEEQEQTLRHEMSCVEASANAHYQEAVRELQHCADKHQEQMLHMDHANKSLVFYKQQACTFEAELQHQRQDLACQEQRICDFGRAELTAMTAQQEANLQAHVDAVSSAKTEDMIAEAVAASQARHMEEVAELRGSHAAMVAAVHGEYSGQIAAMRHLELAGRDELATARLACEAAEAAGEETFHIEAEKVRVAQRRVRDEAVALRLRGEKLHIELRKELFEGWHSEHWVESFNKARSEVLEEVRSNPCSPLRRELCRDLRHELSDQLRAEIHREMRSELNNSFSSGANGSPPPRAKGSPASSGCKRRSHQHLYGHKTAAFNSPGIAAGASPSSIGACSTVGSSPACASSALLLPPESSSSCWADGFEHAFKDLGASAVFGLDQEEPVNAKRPTGVSSAPVSRQTSTDLVDTMEPMRPTAVTRQWTDPTGASPSRLVANPPPQHPSSLDMTFSSLPAPPGPLRGLSVPREFETSSFKSASTLPPPPGNSTEVLTSTSFQDQASAVLEMVSRSRAPFRAGGFPRQGQELTRSFGRLPAWPGQP
jgi:hypothetical protein